MSASNLKVNEIDEYKHYEKNAYHPLYDNHKSPLFVGITIHSDLQ